METVLKLVAGANRHLHTADHLTYVTYPLLKDVKLIFAVIENLHTAYVSAMDAFLTYERLYKRIMTVPDDYKSRLDIFKTKIVKRYNIDREHILIMEDLAQIIAYRRKSPVEFVKDDKLVICSDTYRMKNVTYDNVKEYLNKSKPFFSRMNRVLERKW